MQNPKRQSYFSTRQEIVAWVLFLFGFCGIPGGFAGAIAFPQLAKDSLGLECLWWEGLITGCVLGMMMGALLTFFTGKKKTPYARNHQEASSIKAPNLANEKSIGDSIRLLLGSSYETWFDLSDQKQVKNSKVSLGELTITFNSYTQSSPNRPLREVTQTVMVFEDPDLNLPEFALQPNKKIPSFLANLFTGGGTSLEEFPEFSTHYHLVGLEARLKKLFTGDLVALLTRQPIWEIHASKTRMILFVPRKVYQGENRDRFSRRAMKLAQAFEQRCTALKQDYDFNQPVSREEIQTQVEKTEGLLGTLSQQAFRKTFISRDEVREFISQPRPRVIPKPLSHQTGPDLFLLLFGLIVAISGVFMVFVTSEVDPEDKLVMGMVAGGCFLAGGLLVFLATFFSWRKRAILRNGLATPGDVTKVESTGLINGDKRMYRCHVEFLHGGTKKAASCLIDQTQAKRARAAIDEQRPTMVLINPSNTKRCLLPELMAMV